MAINAISVANAIGARGILVKTGYGATEALPVSSIGSREILAETGVPGAALFAAFAGGVDLLDADAVGRVAQFELDVRGKGEHRREDADGGRAR